MTKGTRIMNYAPFIFGLTLTAATLTSRSTAADITLGTAGNFTVLAGSTVTNTGPTVVIGDLGVWPGNAVTGFPPGNVVTGSIYNGDQVARQGQIDLTAAYNSLQAMVPTHTLTGTDLGGLTLQPGVYFFASSAFLTGTLTLDGMGDPNAVFVFQMGSTLITGSSAAVVSINGASGCNIYWQVGSSATLGTDTAFQGNIVAMASITFNARASISDGKALARDGAVTLSSSTVAPCFGCVADFNQDGGVDGADCGAFFFAWENAEPRTDVNHDGGIDGSDVSAFFEQWESGGC
jgi:hypothetical protein